MGRDRRPNGSEKERRRKKEQDDRKRRRSSSRRSSSSSTDEVMNGSRLRRSGRRQLKRLEARVAAGHEAFTALWGQEAAGRAGIVPSMPRGSAIEKNQE